MTRVSTANLLIVAGWAVPVAIVAYACDGPRPATRQTSIAVSSIVEIELDVFSGRPNPRWQPSPGEAAALAKAIGSLGSAAEKPAEPGLGYRGFRIKLADGNVWVFGELVVIERHGEDRTFRDTAGLERALTAEARRRGLGDLVPPTPGR